MVLDALPRREAAEKAGITEHTLYKAMRKPTVMAYMRSQMQVLRESAAARTIAKAEQLMDKAQSEHVQADMTKWLAGLEGISPTQRIENTHIHRNTQPGLVLNLIIGEPARMIDSQVHEGENSLPINGLPKAVPHPSMRNATPKVIDQPGNRDGQAPGPGGAKCAR